MFKRRVEAPAYASHGAGSQGQQAGIQEGMGADGSSDGGDIFTICFETPIFDCRVMNLQGEKGNTTA